MQVNSKCERMCFLCVLSLVTATSSGNPDLKQNQDSTGPWCILVKQSLESSLTRGQPSSTAAPSQNHPQSMPVECHACLFHTQTIPQQETKLSNVCRCNTGTDFLNATWCWRRGSSITHCSFYFHDRSATHSAFASDPRLLQITETVNRCPRSCITILSTPGTTGTYENI